MENQKIYTNALGMVLKTGEVEEADYFIPISSSVSILRATFHQGTKEVFAYGGSQCTGCCASFAAHAKLEVISKWKPDHVDEIMLRGYPFYRIAAKKCNRENQFLKAQEVDGIVLCRRSIRMSCNVKMDINWGLYEDFSGNSDKLAALPKCINAFSNSEYTSALLMFGDHSFCVAKESNNSDLGKNSSEFIYFFNPHSCNVFGKPYPEGTACVLKYAKQDAPNLIHSYIQDYYGTQSNESNDADVRQFILTPFELSEITRELLERTKSIEIMPHQLKARLDFAIINGNHCRTLLVDCGEDSNSQAKLARFIRYVYVENLNIKDIQKSKCNVINFIKAAGGDSLLDQLHAPGHYKDIVITDKSITKLLRFGAITNWLPALSKWNEHTPTKIHIFEGGISKLIETYPEMMLRIEDQSIKAFDELMEVHAHDGNQQAIPEVWNVAYGIVRHLSRIDACINMSHEIITIQDSIKSLHEVKTELLREHKDCTHTLITNAVPEALKCSICKNVFTAHIYQCANGHGVCTKCSKIIKNCPDCKSQHKESGQYIRNRMVEDLMHVFRYNCVSQQMVTSSEIRRHFKECALAKVVPPIVAELEAKICVKQESITKLADKLTRNQKEMVESKEWNLQISHIKDERVRTMFKTFVQKYITGRQP